MKRGNLKLDNCIALVYNVLYGTKRISYLS